jgi:hypothetical protein
LRLIEDRMAKIHLDEFKPSPGQMGDGLIRRAHWLIEELSALWDAGDYQGALAMILSVHDYLDALHHLCRAEFTGHED